MAKKTIVQLTDDVDGGEASQTITFALDGTAYEIDLNDANAASLRDAVAPYLKAGRRVAAANRPAATRVSVAHDPKAVRAWAESNHVEIPARGRIPLAVLEQFHAAGN